MIPKGATPSPAGSRGNRRITVWALLSRQPGRTALAFTCTLLGAALALSQPAVAGRIVNSIGAGDPVSGLLLALVTIVVGQIVVETAAGYTLEVMGEDGARHVRSRLAGSVMGARFDQLTSLRTGDLVSRFTTDADAVRQGVSKGHVEFATAAVSSVGAAILLGRLDLLLLATIAVILVTAGVGCWLLLGRLETAVGQRQEAVGTLGAAAERLLTGMRTIRLFGAQDSELASAREAFDSAFHSGRRVSRWTAAAMPALHLAATGSFLALVLIGGSRVATGDLALSDLVAALLYSTYLVVPLGSFIEAGVALSTAGGALHRVNTVLDFQDEESPSPGQKGERGHREQAGKPLPSHPPVPARPDDAHDAPASGLVIDRLHHVLPDGRDLYRGLSLTVPAGSAALVCGPSGSGKTTLVDIVCRYVEPTSGSVHLNDLDILQSPQSRVRQRIGLVEQDSPMLHGTVRSALVAGREGIGDTRLLAALAQVELLERLGGPESALNRQLGERGSGISGGERQRLALARALLDAPELLILDEPTASLDAASRDTVLRLFRNRPAWQTLLVISHHDEDADWVDIVLRLNPIPSHAQEHS